MKLQRINDERLVMKNLQNIRMIYAIQTLGIIGILAYDFITKGMDGIRGNLFLSIIFIVSTILLAFFPMNSDERLVLKNLQKIRLAYAIQTLGIVGILAYEFVSNGMNGVNDNPLWIIFIVSTTILACLSMNISVDHETNINSTKKGLFLSLIVLLLISTAAGIFTSLSEGYTVIHGILTGGIFFICGSIPFLFLYNLREKNKDE